MRPPAPRLPTPLRGRRRLTAALSLLAFSTAVALAPACEVFTRETCNAADLVAIPEADPARLVCKQCLERAATCDTVGRCNDVSGCTQRVRDAHGCVLAAGKLAFRDESKCVAPLDETSRDAYEKMRASCGSECVLPVCKVDQAAVRFGSAECDKCVTGACCEEINRCYANRTCKLILECIVRCPDALAGPSLPADRGPCAADDDGGPPGGCVGKCLGDFASYESRAPEDRKDSAACLAFTIRGCAIGVGCAATCDGGLAAP